MKKVTNTLCVLVLTTFLGMSNPVYAQTGDSPATRSETIDDRNDDDDDDMGKWGLAGLLGLLGLIGLKRHDRDNHRTHSGTPNR